MGHGKLKKFAENETFRCLLQPDASSVLAKPEGSRELVLRDHAIKGNWNRDMFEKPQPIVLELGCGKGDYTIALARRHPEMNFIGVDIKGARLWKGAKEATEEKMGNVARSAAPRQRERPPDLPAFPPALPPFPETRRHRPPQDRLPLPLRIHPVRHPRQ